MHIPFVVRTDRVKPAITVWLDDDTDGIIKNFRCCVCGDIVFQYHSSVRLMVVGGVGYLQAPIVLQCNGKAHIETPTEMITKSCKTRYFVVKR